MQLTEDQAEEVKKWVVKKLEDISDADSDVLADYVLALIRTDAPDDEIRTASVENLEDFLREHTADFVQELFATFAPKQQPAPTQAQAPQSTAMDAQPNLPNIPTGPMNGPCTPQAPFENSTNSRKRTYDDGFSTDQGREDVPHHRNFKNPRRGRGGRGDWMVRDGHHAAGGPGQFPHPAAGGFPPMPPPTFPGFDQNDPMAAMMALQSMGFPQMPGMPPMPMPPGGGAGQQPDQMGQKSSERCPFYETQGICYLGDACPYSHDMVPNAKNDEYDPKASNIVSDFRPLPDNSMRGNDRGRGRGRGRGGDRGGFANRGRRSEFSATGPNEDQSVTTIVVEQIPDDKLDDSSIREFFSQYGEVTDISLQVHKKLALVTFIDHAAAKRAWSSPKVIFDNRFVKVYWHKSKGDRNDQRPGGNESREDSQPFDPEEFQRQQEAAQKAHEEKAKRRKETEEAKQALEKQREELMKKQEEEKQRLLQRIGGASSGSATPDGGAAQSPSDENASEQTKKLRAQLAALEAEAQSLGLDPNNHPDSGSYRGRGRGRGSYPPRGRGYDPSYRGSYRGRGGFAARGRGGVLRLDNRPKRVAVSGIKPNSEQDEAFRQFLIGVGEYESITPNPSEANSLIIAFKERYIAEKFMYGPHNIPSVGEVQLTWVPNPPISLPSASNNQAAATPSETEGKGGLDEDTIMDSGVGDQNGANRGKDVNMNADVDYDVAEVDDSWGVE
ncbi:hypothetical protein BJY04DRAFT_10525 [Aspergillus karnatakaensis]|uniref:CCCH zinc finger and RRM domain protein n=1 Tax=Aspergillus karnatakaensis TaxID=1810916 RepID=UPI003CCCB77D